MTRQETPPKMNGPKATQGATQHPLDLGEGQPWGRSDEMHAAGQSDVGTQGDEHPSHPIDKDRALGATRMDPVK